jgi:hypothetical protein
VLRITTVLAGTSLAVATAFAPPAHAVLVNAQCVGSVTNTVGNMYAGLAAGVAVIPTTATHTLRCYATVNGVEQSSTPVASGSVVITVAGPITLVAGPLDPKELCTEVDGVTVGACVPL